MLRKFALAISVLAFAFSPVVGLAVADVPTPQNLTPAGFGDARQPQIAVAPSGKIYVVFGRDSAVYITSSTDHGQTFSAPAKVGTLSKMPLGMRRGPRVAISAKRIVVTAPSDDLISFISDDDGQNWTKAVVNDKSQSANEGLQNLTVLPDGSFYAVWLDFRGDGKTVDGARLDSGATAWGKNVVVYHSPEKGVCDCCHPSITVDAKGTLTAMWRNSLGGNRDFYFAQSSDRGDTFSPATKLGDGSWKLNACPMDGGGLIATPDSGIVTVWRRMSDVYIDKPGEPETKIGRGMQPVIAQIGGDVFCVWQDRDNLDIAKDSGRTQVTAIPGSYPALAVSPDGKEGYLVSDHVEANVGTPQFVVLR